MGYKDNHLRLVFYLITLQQLWTIGLGFAIPSPLWDYTGHDSKYFTSINSKVTVPKPCNLRYWHSLEAGDTLEAVSIPGDMITAYASGAIDFDGSTVPNPFGAIGGGVNVIMPLYDEWDDGSALWGATDFPDWGLYYKLLYLDTDLSDSAEPVSMLKDCFGAGHSLMQAPGFKPTFALSLSWSKLLGNGQAPGSSGDHNAATSVFQVILIGNAADLFLLFNYKLSSTGFSTTGTPVLKIQGTTGELLINDGYYSTLNGNSNCVTPVWGRYAYYVSDIDILQPDDPFNCPAGFPCGEYSPVRCSPDDSTANDAGALACGTANDDCGCVDGYSSLYCVIDDANNCNSDPCDPDHTVFCEDTGYSTSPVCDPSKPAHKCHCDMGWDPDQNCAAIIDFCVPNNPCKNGGTCNSKTEGYECDCDTGYTGPTCDVALCASDPTLCQPGGVCSDLGTPVDNIGYECTCNVGWLGTLCDEPDCMAWIDDATCPVVSKQGFKKALCGGCAQVAQTRVCVQPTDGSGPHVTARVGPCNVEQCNRTPEYLVEKGRGKKGGRIIKRIRHTCLDYRYNPARELPRPKPCRVKKGPRNGPKILKDAQWRCFI